MVESGWYGLGRVGIGVGGGCAGPDVVGPRLSSFPPTHTVGDRYKYPPARVPNESKNYIINCYSIKFTTPTISRACSHKRGYSLTNIVIKELTREVVPL